MKASNLMGGGGNRVLAPRNVHSNNVVPRQPALQPGELAAMLAGTQLVLSPAGDNQQQQGQQQQQQQQQGQRVAFAAGAQQQVVMDMEFDDEDEAAAMMDLEGSWARLAAAGTAAAEDAAAAGAEDALDAAGAAAGAAAEQLPATAAGGTADTGGVGSFTDDVDMQADEAAAAQPAAPGATCLPATAACTAAATAAAAAVTAAAPTAAVTGAATAAANAAANAPAIPLVPSTSAPVPAAAASAVPGAAATEPSLPDPSSLSEAALCRVLKGVFGHAAFRGRQLDIIRAVLRGESTLGILPTGAGKSLCYQLPAMLLPGLVVVVSPLLALMRDQLSHLPRGLPGAMLQGGMSRDQVEEVLTAATSGQLKLLYVAPEKLASAPVMSALRALPPLALVCVDEAHCVAEWGDSFRPAYFRLGHLLREVLRPKAVLALTATATLPTQRCICSVLGIGTEGVVRDAPLRANLRLHVAHMNGGAAGGAIRSEVLQMLTRGELAETKSVVVYCGWKSAADTLASSLVQAGVDAASYHAGKTLQQRDTVQAAFLSDRLRVVCASVAFGMGLDKARLGAIIHTVMPHSLEEYVQQVGRAGRDGSEAKCWLFLDDADYVKLRSLGFSGAVERRAVGTLVEKALGPVEGCSSEYRVVPVKELCLELDTTEEVLESALSFMQASRPPHLLVLPNTAATLDIRFHRCKPHELAQQSTAIAALINSRARAYGGNHKAHMRALVAASGLPPADILGQLAALAASREVSFDLGRDQALAWRVCRGAEDAGALADALVARLDKVVAHSVSRLDAAYEAFSGAAMYQGSPAAQERHLRGAIARYFDEEGANAAAGAAGAAMEAVTGGPCAAGPSPAELVEMERLSVEAGAGSMGAEAAGPSAAEAARHRWAEQLRQQHGQQQQQQQQQQQEPEDEQAPGPIRRPDAASLGRSVRAFLRNSKDRIKELGPQKMTALAVARVLHGLASPVVVADQWRRCGDWGRMQAVDFGVLVVAARNELDVFWEAQAQDGADSDGM